MLYPLSYWGNRHTFRGRPKGYRYRDCRGPDRTSPCEIDDLVETATPISATATPKPTITSTTKTPQPPTPVPDPPTANGLPWHDDPVGGSDCTENTGQPVRTATGQHHESHRSDIQTYRTGWPTFQASSSAYDTRSKPAAA